MTRSRWTVFAVLIALVASAAEASKLDRFLERKRAKAKVPGMATALVVGDEIVQAAGYGWADVDQRVPATADTLFLLASVSKPVTAALAMRLVERGALDLDADVNHYLPFEVRNPFVDEPPITLRQLLAHTSSISDEAFYERRTEFVVDGDWPGSLSQFLVDYLTPAGRYYDAQKTFLDSAPGTRASYSNVGYALIGALVEAVTGKSFEIASQERLLIPLDMTESSWLLGNLDETRVAVPYSQLGASPAALPHLGMAPWPSGQLRTSSAQLAHFAVSLLSEGRFEGRRVLRRSTVEEMFVVQFPEADPSRAISFTILEQDGRRYAYHEGGVGGCTTKLWIDLDADVAVIVLTNGEAWRSPKRLRALEKIQKRLFKVGRRSAEREPG